MLSSIEKRAIDVIPRRTVLWRSGAACVVWFKKAARVSFFGALVCVIMPLTLCGWLVWGILDLWRAALGKPREPMWPENGYARRPVLPSPDRLKR